MRPYKQFLNLVFILTLVLGALGSTPTYALAGNDNEEPKADPRLLQMAEENPEAIFRVIVQKEAKNNDVEDEVLKGGGQVKKQLDIIVSFSAEMTGKEIVKLARHPKVRWVSVDAPMVSSAAGNPYVLDNFGTAAFTNNNGTQTWAGNWLEAGDGTASATSGYIKIASGQLQLSSTNRTLSRQANMSGATFATLTFLYKRSGLDDANDYVAIQASNNGGSNWTELARYQGAATDSAWQSASFNILSYAATNTQIRFATSSTLGTADYLYVDDVKIEYALAPATFVVNNTGDGADANNADGICQTSTAGQCTLRAALQQANASTGRNTINFNISGTGPHTIQPASALPTITDPVVVNGASEPDFAGSPIIELNGSLAGTGVNGLTIQAGNSTIRGLVINRFSSDGLRLDVNGNNLVMGNFIGTDTSGTLDRGNLGSGILLYYQSGNNTIGGTTPADRNVISGNDYHGIFNQWSASNIIQGNIIGLNAAGTTALPNGSVSQNTSGTGIYIQQADGNLIGGGTTGAGNIISGNLSDGLFASNSNNTTIRGNFIGTNAAGTLARSNGRTGVFVSGGSGTQIGGTATDERNVISGNGSDGIDFQSVGAQIQGNYVGTDVSGTSSLPNGYVGIKLNGYAGNVLVGGTTTGAGNLVANNYGGGIVVAGDTVTGNAVLGNSVHSNNGLGLNLGWDGVTINNGVTGSGANNGMDYPVITSAFFLGCYLNVSGYVGSAANQTTFANARVEFFKSSNDTSGYGEGQTYLGYLTTDANGSFSGSFQTSGITPGASLTATATDGSNNTSEFGPNFPLAGLGACLTSPFTKIVRTDQLASSLKGQGITVAVVDTGITSNPDLQGRILVNKNQTAEADASDGYGHGTHVAGIIAGNGASSGGLFAGVAPQANLVNVKVSASNGMTYASDFVDGLQWIHDNRATYNIKVVNISMNSTIAESYNTSPIDAAVEILWFNGIVVVVSAGNNGTAAGPSTLYPPANDPFVMTVGATADDGTINISDDTVAVFSAYGTTEDGFAKPDLVAPGRNFISLLASTSSDGYINHPAHRFNNYYFRMTGTSMSAPVVTGAVALLLQDEPNLTPDQVKYRLMATANKSWTGYNASKAGAGYLDIYAAINGPSTQSANTGSYASQMLSSGSTPISWSSVGWNSVGWNSVGWNSVGWNSVGWNSVGWNSVGWNSSIWDD